MQIFLVRHAQPKWVDDRGFGVNNPELTELGRTQAARLAERVDAFGSILHFWASPTQRTLQTAQLLSEAWDAQPRIIDDLREIETPDWENEKANNVMELFAEAGKRSVDQWWQGLPGAETFIAFESRVRAAFEGALEAAGVRRRAESPLWNVADPNKNILFVGHGGTNAVLLETLLGIDSVPWAWERFVYQHASVTRLKTSAIADGFVFGLRELNDVEHLPQSERSR